jgi:hypothetical protein
VNEGYVMTPQVFLESISEHNRAVVLNSISRHLFDPTYTALYFWWILANDCFAEAIQFVESSETAMNYAKSQDVSSPQGAFKALNDPDLLRIALRQALELGQDLIASRILGVESSAIDLDCIRLAIDHDCLEFLK